MIKVHKITEQNTLYSNSSSTESNSNCNSNLNTQELLDKYKSHTKKDTENKKSTETNNKTEKVEENITKREQIDNITDKKKHYKQKIKNNEYIDLCFDINKKYETNNYKILSKYIKKNKNNIINELYNKNIIKKKDIPFRILFHIYTNYLNNDLDLVFL